jgi:hypothetical protein
MAKKQEEEERKKRMLGIDQFSGCHRQQHCGGFRVNPRNPS